MDTTTPGRRGSASKARRIIVAVIVISFAIAAALGIVVLLGGPIDDVGWRVISTTSIVGAFSIAVLCCSALLGKRLSAFGLVGTAVSIAGAVFAVIMVWLIGGVGYPDWMYRVLWTLVAATIAFAVSSLLLLLADRTRAGVRVGLIITLVLFAVLLALVIYTVWWPDSIDWETMSRVIGIVSILCALGAVVVPVLSLLLKEGGAAEDASISAHSLALLAAEAERRGVSVDALVASLVGDAPPGAVDAHPGADLAGEPPVTTG